MNSVKNRQIKPPINTTKTNLIIKNNKIPDQTLKCKNTSPWNNSKPKESKTIKESSVLKYIFLYTYKNLFIIYFFKKKKFQLGNSPINSENKTAFILQPGAKKFQKFATYIQKTWEKEQSPSLTMASMTEQKKQAIGSPQPDVAKMQLILTNISIWLK